MSLLQMSFSGAVMILVIVVIRALAIHKLPKNSFLLLWGVATVRLLIPYSLPSAFSVYSLLERTTPMAETVAEAGTGTSQNIPTVPFTPIVPAYQTPSSPAVSAETAATVDVDPWAVVWAIGALACMGFFAVAYCKCRREFQASFPIDNEYARRWLSEHCICRRIEIRQSGRISAPLTYGVLRPVILMPKAVDWDDEVTLSYVLTHEYVHIRRFDAGTKLALTAAVCVHWFNPAVWVMYILANRDIELGCDEAVVRRFGERAKPAYAMALIRMEERRSDLMPLCNSFSKNAIEERIIAIMKTRRTSLAALIAAAVLVVGVTGAFATSAKASEDSPGKGPAPVPDTVGADVEVRAFSFEHTTFRYGEREYDMTLRNPSINSILSAEPVGDKIVVECHVGPHNGVYCIFDTASETFEKDIVGHHLIWHSDDITTAVYGFWSAVYTYDGSLIKNYDLDELAVDGGMIYEMRFSDDHTKLYVTIVYNEDEETDTIDISELTQNNETTNRRENDMRIGGNSFTENVYQFYRKNQAGSFDGTRYSDLLQSSAGDVQNVADPEAQVWSDYQAWKSQQPPRKLPNSRGLTEENLAYLRENFSGELSLFQRIEAADTMREMGIITEDQMMNALGFGEHRFYTVTSSLIVEGSPEDSEYLHPWNFFFSGAPLMQANNLNGLFGLLDKQLKRDGEVDIAEQIQAVLNKTTRKIPE